MAPRPPTLGRTPAQPWRASGSTPDVSLRLRVADEVAHDLAAARRSRRLQRDFQEQLHEAAAEPAVQRGPRAAGERAVARGQPEARAADDPARLGPVPLL